jgi:hypothetical protein
MTKLPHQMWQWDDDAESAFVAWFNSPTSESLFSLMSEYFYTDCRVEDEKTREDLLYKWIHLAFVTGYMYGKPVAEHGSTPAGNPC